ncbi:4-carboxy-4-hydroxy-2-oxoadipate aldolase/oxaloacetate decarboxylase [Dongia deserti]|uniref:4-carboxy-4-hydroxy-2-oxoadipate aldolase/oxaloacetate decarboxylase n=1 Tax=Dongia deserti TaxID=2268030 RepID=UPI000E64B2BA|nr:4-carboxy-4-hydroxy-2-oxoadipate aldolase/oxaloacetate decarboxylase [Dongia deserti]
MRPVAIRNIERADAAVLARLGAAGVSTVHEAQGRTGLAKTYLRPAWSGASAHGSAVTVLARPGDNWMIHVAVELCQPGDMLVVAVSSDNYDGMFGELLATSLRARGVRGLIIDAGCRDVAALKELGFPVWSRCISGQGTVKATLGAVNVPVVVAGVAVSPGDAVVADDDGVVFVSRAMAADVAGKCDARIAKEKGVRRRLAAGELGLDIYGMRDALAKAGLVYLDDAGELGDMPQ